MTARLRIGWRVVLLVAATSACGGGPVAGGQSGTDAEGVQACPPASERSVAFDEVTSRGSAEQLREKAEQALATAAAIPLRWTPEVGGSTTLAIELREWGSHATFFDRPGKACDQLLVPATLRLSTADGLLDETLAGSFQGTQWSAGYNDVAAVQSSAIGERLLMRIDRPGLTLRSFGVLFYTERWGRAEIWGQLSVVTDSDDKTVVAPLLNLAQFDSAWPQGVALDEPYQRPEALDAACGAVQKTMPSAFARSDAGIADPQRLETLDGVWVKCSGQSTEVPRDDGIRFEAGVAWRHLEVHDGALIERLGFGHEGRLGLLGPQLLLWDALPFHSASPDVELSSDHTTLRLRQRRDDGLDAFDNTYVRTDMPVGAALVPRAQGERAGAAACADGEAHVHLFASEDDLRARLTGGWSVCTGGFRDDATAIAFAADGTYEHQDQNGHGVAAGHYVIVDISGPNGPGAFQVNLTDDDGVGGVRLFVVPAMSDAPIKLWVGDHAHTVLSALP